VVGVLVGLAILGTFVFKFFYEFGANLMLLQFAAGVLLARAAQTDALGGLRASVGFLIVGLAAFAAMQIAGVFSELWRPLLWGVPAVVIVMGAVGVEQRVGVFRSNALKALGDASYAIYIVHLPVSAVVAHLVGHDHVWPLVPAAVVASTAAGLAWRAWVEKPLMGLLRGAPSHREVLSAT
jgi:exopolysaccharide production protein ExoZ